jgi:hypothetical protein
VLLEVVDGDPCEQWHNFVLRSPSDDASCKCGTRDDILRPRACVVDGGLVSAKEGAIRNRDLASKDPCKDWCQFAVPSCGTGNVFKCSVGDCINTLDCNSLDSPDKKNCQEWCKLFNPAGDRCDPGVAAGSCPLGPDFSTGDCIKLICPK